MRRWIAAAALALFANGCGGADGDGQSMQGGRDSAADGSSRGMSGMQGMGSMESMDRGPGASASESAGVRLDRRAAERLGITFARAAMRPVGRGARVVGTLTYAEPRREYVNARVMGWVEELYADFAGKPVRKGQPLLALYAPELVSAQEEYLTARRLGDSSLAAAARRRLQLWDVPEDQLVALERGGTAQRRIVLHAPRSGEIAEKMVTQGQAVQAGDNLFLIADPSTLWVDLAVFEADARMLKVGMPVTVRVDALPGRTYQGRVTFIHPTVDEKTRTLTARVEIANRDGRLRPGMFATAELQPAATKRLSIPLTSVLPTGTENLVFVNRGDGQFVPREVQVGARGDSLVEIVDGLKPGDEVVASATYLLDSESNLASAMQGLMLQMGMGLDMGGMDMGGQGSGGAAGQTGKQRDMKGMKMEGEDGR
ncbi:MAG: efflux RND transporter periplasmic adaptor subunit [Gemmatimonadales bacterium]|nr:efflux RND transporter periplasmic adaptor subunit [Gemmatimonadales bacterium]